jgi:hypothetical protein
MAAKWQPFYFEQKRSKSLKREIENPKGLPMAALFFCATYNQGQS